MDLTSTVTLLFKVQALYTSNQFEVYIINNLDFLSENGGVMILRLVFNLIQML